MRSLFPTTNIDRRVLGPGTVKSHFRETGLRCLIRGCTKTEFWCPCRRILFRTLEQPLQRRSTQERSDIQGVLKMFHSSREIGILLPRDRYLLDASTDLGDIQRTI